MSESLAERTVEVVDLPEGVDEELLYLYFENRRRSGGGLLESVQIKGNHAVLVFEEEEVAARVLSKEKHILHQFTLSVRKPLSKDQKRLLLCGINPDTSTEMVELYVENMLDLNMADYTLITSPGRDCILLRLNQPLSKDFLKISQNVSRRKLDGSEVALERIDVTDSVLVENLPLDATPDLISLYFESVRGGNQKVKKVVALSEASAKVSFENHCSVDVVLGQQHKLNDAELVVKEYFDFLQSTDTCALEEKGVESPFVTQNSKQENLCLSSPIEAEPPSFVGDGQNCSAQEALQPFAATEVPQEEEESMVEEAGPFSCNVEIREPAKQTLFHRSTFQEDLQKLHPNISFEMKGNCLTVVGPDRHQVEQIKDLISAFIGSMITADLTLLWEDAQFLNRKDVKDRLLQSMNQRGLSAVYTVSNTSLTVTSLSQKSLEQVFEFLKSQVCHFSVAVAMEQEALLDCREWQEFLQGLAFTSLKVSDHKGAIHFLTLNGMENEKKTAITEFLTTPIEKKTVISMTPGMLKYIQIHCHQLLADMEEVSIFPLEAEECCGLKIHGQVIACQMAEEVLQGVVSSVCTRTITVNVPGVARFIDDKECRSILNEMETKFQVYINPKYVMWKPIQQQDIFKTAWKFMCQKNIPKFKGASQALKSHSVQMDMDNNASSNTGLLNEAERLVSSSVKSQDNSGSAPNLPDEIDDLDLYTAEESDSREQNIVGKSARSFQPLDEPNAEECPYISSLEEEAQLSLAIQYSMESNQSFLNYDEQLQHALELSKKLIQEEGSWSIPENDEQRNGNMSFSLEEASRAANSLQLEVFAGYSCDLIRVDIAFNKKVKQRQSEKKVEHKAVGNMSEYDKTCLEVIKCKHAVEVQVQGTIIAVSGFADYVNDALLDVTLLLERMSNALSDEQILKSVQWLHHSTPSSNKTPYSPEATFFIENAWRMNLKMVDILLDNQPHVINFEKMQEYNIASGKTSKISRKLLDLVDLTQDVPEEEYSLLANLPDATKVSEDSDEFQDVVKNFYGTIQEYHSKIRIIQVEKLQNRLLYNQYMLKKASILQQSTHPVAERVLYHGTSEESVKEICLHGFNRSFCGKNATVYGQGVYFAVNSALSVQEQYSPPNADGYKFVFVSKVLTGDFTKGCHSMKTAPLKESGNIPLRYDSVTDDITKPTMFIIFNDTQAFPQYLITCQRIGH